MSTHTVTNKVKYFIYLFICLFATGMMTSCRDDTFDDYDGIIGEGDADLRATVEFENLTPALDTRTPGNAIGAVQNLQMVIYKVENGQATFYKRVVCNNLQDYKLTTSGNAAEPGDVETGNSQTGNGQFESTEEHTDHADFTYNLLPYGRYKIYAVGNVPNLTDDDCTTEEKLKSMSFNWNETNIAANNAMFGYFTRGDDQSSSGFEAPILIVNSPKLDIHAWIKRMASKVTVAFDPSGLKESVTVYIKNVTIHDIPKSCYLGKDNKPTSDAELIKNGEQIKYYTDATANDYTKWGIILQKGSGKKGSNHSNTADALYFFENMQGDFEGQKSYLKEQIPDETGTSINAPGENQYGTGSNDFKDRVPYGTYIEVEAYYVSKNTEKMSSGNIKYRFMLGKNITYNYDAQRNYHYKLTLKLRGFANEADWHIVYEEPTPSVYTPDSFNVSYLYGQEHGLPVRVIVGEGNIDDYYLRAEITTNGWYPNINGTTNLPAQTIGAYNDVRGFAWNQLAYKTTYKDANYPGYLSMRQPASGDIYPDMAFGTEADQALDTYYKNHRVAYGAYSLEAGTGRVIGYWDTEDDKGTYTTNGITNSDGTYSVTHDSDGSATVRIPVYTRQKKLVTTSDFCGSNPFWNYTRPAEIKITLWTKTGKQVKFKDLADNSKDVWERIIPVSQVRRIENPTAIYRRHDNDDPFEVELLYLESASAINYTKVTSDGPWRASILTDPDGLVKLTGNGKEVTNSTSEKYITGSTGTTVKFTYQPRGTIGEKQTRCAIILVEYHDYNCKHYIYVRQGYNAPVTIAGTKWSCYQVYATGGPTTSSEPTTATSVNVYVTKSPLSIGTMYKRNGYNYGILESNIQNFGWLDAIQYDTIKTCHLNGNSVNTKDVRYDYFGGFGWLKYDANNSTKPATSDKNYPVVKLSSYDIRYDRKWADTWTTVIHIPNQKLTVPTAEQYTRLRDQAEFAFGIAYGDGATAPSMNRDDATGFTDFDNTGNNSSQGVRVCIAYSSSNGNNILFPLGSLSQGRRARQVGGGGTPLTGQTVQTTISNPGPGSISYGGLTSLLYGERNLHRPLTYNIYRSPGAVYWVKQPVLTPEGYPDYASWDINYYTSTFNHYDYGTLGNWRRYNDVTGAGAPDYTYSYNSSTKLYTFTYKGSNAANCSDALPIKLVYQ